MVNKLFEHIGTKVVLANPWLDTYSVNCIELPLKDGEKRIVNIEGDEKEDFSINDISGNGFYIKINPRFTYTEQRQVSSSQKDFLVSIRFRFVFFGINTEIEWSKLGLENKFGTAFRNISFSDYIGNERSIKLSISQTNIDAVQIFKEEVGKDYDFGAESVFIALDGVLSFLSTDNYCDSECGIAVSESTLKTLDFCDPAIIALLNAKQRECLENEFGGGGLTCEDLSTCQVITEIQSDLATETSERISEDAALLALIQAIAPTLAQVLANGNATNETSILSNNGKSQMKANNAESLLRFIDGVTSGGLTNNFSKTKIDHTSEVEIDSPLIRLVIGHLEGNLLKAKLALLDNQSSLTFDNLTVISGVVADIARHESFFFDGTVYASLKHETAKSSFVHPTLIELTAPSVKINSDQALAYKWYNDVNANSNGIINLRDAVAPQEPITKSQFDSYNASVGRQRGAIDCSSNPNYPASNVGDRWEVTVAGKIGGALGIDVQIYDEIVCKTQSVAGDQATVGANFYIVQGNLERASEIVSGYTQYATDAEVQTGTENTKTFTPLKLTNWWSYIKGIANTWASKQTFTTAPRLSSNSASTPLAVDSNKDVSDLTDSIWGAFLNGLTGKTTPVDTDSIGIVDSADSNKSKKLTFTNLKAFLKTYFDTQYANSKQITLFYQRTEDVTYTGFTGNTFLEEVQIPANYLGPNSEIEVSATFERNSGGTSTNTCYVGLSNTSASFNSRGYIQMTTAQLQSGIFKRFVFKNGNDIKHQQISAPTQEFYTPTNNVRNTLTLDRTQPIYVSFGGNLGTSTDSIIINEYRIMIYNRA